MPKSAHQETFARPVVDDAQMSDRGIAVVTGASRNIGWAIASDLAEQGFRVVGICREATALESRIRAAGYDDQMMSVSVDLADSDAVRAAADNIKARGTVSILVNNAAYRATFGLAEHPLSEWDRVLAVGLTAPFLLSQGFVPDMVAAGWGRVVNIAGLGGQRGSRKRAAVVSAKAGLIGLTKALALETGGTGVTVNSLSPGAIDSADGERKSTGRLSDVSEIYSAANPDHMPPIGRRGTVEDVVNACRFLVSDAAAFITGQTLSVSGGLVM